MLKFSKKDVNDVDFHIQFTDTANRAAPYSAMNQIIDVLNPPGTFFFFACGYSIHSWSNGDPHENK